MEGIGFFVVFIVISIISNIAKQNKKKNQRANTSTYSAGNKTATPSAQVGLRNLVSQLESKIEEAAGITTPAKKGMTSGNTRMQSMLNTNRATNENPSLEGHQMEGHQVEGHQMEGRQVEGHKVEGYQVEGIDADHRHNLFTRESRLVTMETSMNRNIVGEGCETHYNTTGSKSSGKRGRDSKKGLVFSDNPIVQGIIMSQIVERPNRR